MVQTFCPEVQYGNWHGEAAADDGDFHKTIRRYMEDHGLIRGGEFLVAVRGTNAENTRRGLAPVYVTALLIPATRYEEAQVYVETHDPLPVREVRFSMSVSEWAELFKRFSVALSWQELSLVGRAYQTEDAQDEGDDEE